MITQTKIPTTRTKDAPRPKLVPLIAASTLLWLVLYLVMMDVLVGWVKPMRSVNIPGVNFLDQDPLSDKVQALTSPTSHFNILLLGSSLLVEAAKADLLLEDQKSKQSASISPAYTKALALDKMLKLRLQIPAESFNMGIIACMVQEDLRLLRCAFEAGKKPKVVILWLAPRDFIDNNQVRGAHVCKQLSYRSPFWSQVSLQKSPKENLECLASSLSNIYRSRGEYMLVMKEMACSILHRAPTLYYAVKEKDTTLLKPQSKTIAQSPTGRQKIMEYYRHAYLPINHSRLAMEMKELETILAMCRNHNVLALVVNMPRGQANEQLLPEKFRQTYIDQLNLICFKNKVKVVNFGNSPEFTEDDFLDGVHLCTQGSAKFNRLLCDRLANDPDYCRKLQEAFSR